MDGLFHGKSQPKLDDDWGLSRAEGSQGHAAGQSAGEQRRQHAGKLCFAEALRLLVDQEIDLGGWGPDQGGPVCLRSGKKER